MVAPMVRLALAAVLALLAGAAPALAANASVTASNFQYTPDEVTVNPGDKVTFSNGGGTHNVHFADDQFVEPASPSSAAWVVERTFAAAGDFDYFCDLHGPEMSGTVHVVTPVKNYQWIGQNGGSWETGTNWNPTGVPGTSPTDTATIADGDTVLMAGDHTVARLDMSADSARGGAGTLTLTGGGTWSSARSSGARTIVAAGATLTWSGGFLFAGELENLGTLSIGTVIFGNGSAGADVATLDNQGTLTLTGDLEDASAGGAVIQNPGALNGKGSVGPPLSNSGTVTAQGGVLELSGSVNPNPGDYSAAGGATLRFGGFTTGETGAQVSGAGTVDVQGLLSLPGNAPGNYAVPGSTVVGGVLSISSGSTGTLDLDGDATIALSGPLTVAGGTNTWTTAAVDGSGTVILGGTTTLESVDVRSSAELRLNGPSTLGQVTFGNGDVVPDSAPTLTLAGPATLAATATFADETAGGAPRLDVVAGGTLNLAEKQLTLAVPFSTAGTLAVRLDSASVFGRLAAPAATLGGTLALTRGGGFTPAAADTFRVVATGSQPAGAFASVTGTDLGTRVLEAAKDATGVLVSSKAKPVDPDPTTTSTPTPTPTPTPAPTATPAAPVPTATPSPKVTPPLPSFARLVKLPRCASRRAVRVTLLRSEKVKVFLGSKRLKQATKSFTLRRLPKRAFTLRFEVTIPEGTVKGSKRFKPCKK
jgi:plastocyanin